MSTNKQCDPQSPSSFDVPSATAGNSNGTPRKYLADMNIPVPQRGQTEKARELERRKGRQQKHSRLFHNLPTALSSPSLIFMFSLITLFFSFISFHYSPPFSLNFQFLSLPSLSLTRSSKPVTILSSEADMSLQQSSAIEEQSQPGSSGFTIFFPLILGVATAAPPSQAHPEGSGTPAEQELLLVNPLTGSLIVIGGSENYQQPNKEGPPPASKVSIEAMPAVKIAEEGLECVICLGELEVGGEAKEMPCKHRFHSGCIEKWLALHGSCPFCRYMMPVEEDDEKKRKRNDGNDEEVERGRRVGEGGIQISFFFGDSNSSSVNSSPDNSSDAPPSNDDAPATHGSSYGGD